MINKVDGPAPVPPTANEPVAGNGEMSPAQVLEGLMLPFMQKQMREKLDEVKKDN